MENVKLNVLITGGGAPGAPGIIELLKNSNDEFTIFSCDVYDNVVGKTLADNFFQVLSGLDIGFCDDLLKKCIDYNINVVFPITTNEVNTLSQKRHKFEQNGIKVIVSNRKSLEIANNKGLLLKTLKLNKISVPRFAIVKTVKEFKIATEQYLSSNSRFVIKPTYSNGSRGFRIVNSKVSRSDLLFSSKPNTTFVSYNELESILAEKQFPELLVSDYLPGAEYSIDCLLDDGKPYYIIPRKRTKMREGISIEGQIENNLEIIEYCKSILSCFNFTGPIGIQIKLDHSGKPQILEINPRIQGTSVACFGAGINIPYLAVKNALKRPNTTQLNKNVDWGVRFSRYYQEVYSS